MSNEIQSNGVIIHIGRRAPKGFREVAGSVHLGRGIWALRCVKDDTESNDD